MNRFIIILIAITYAVAATGVSLHMVCNCSSSAIQQHGSERAENEDDCCLSSCCDDADCLGDCMAFKINLKKTTEQHVKSSHELPIFKTIVADLEDNWLIDYDHCDDLMYLTQKYRGSYDSFNHSSSDTPIFKRLCNYRI